MSLGSSFDTEHLYTTYKSLLFTLAYRMLGSVMDAEDIVHESFLALHSAKLESIHNVKSYLCRIVTNRCIDRLRSASHQREVYIGPWLPEPLITDNTDAADPSERFLQQESLSTAYLLLLQQLSWIERAVFLLREVLQYEYHEIAGIVGKSSSNCRQIFHRAKRSIGIQNVQENDDEPSPSLPSQAAAVQTPTQEQVQQQMSQLVGQFLHALSTGNIEALLAVLSADATLYSDGGGKVTAAVRPILGSERIAMFLGGLLSKMPTGFSYQVSTINGQPGIITYVNEHVSSVISFNIMNQCIHEVYIVVNPEKLMHVK